jgi:hypothetical protein
MEGIGEHQVHITTFLRFRSRSMASNHGTAFGQRQMGIAACYVVAIRERQAKERIWLASIILDRRANE